MVLMSVFKKAFRDVVPEDFLLAFDGACVFRYLLYNPRDVLFSVADASSQFR